MCKYKNKFKLTSLFIAIQVLIAFLIILTIRIRTNDIQEFIKNLLFYIIIFIVPIFLYIWRVLHINPLSYLKIKNNCVSGIVKGLGVSVFITIVFFIRNRFIINIDILDSQKILMLIGTVLAGLFEEIPFRGFYLRVFNEQFGFCKANILTAILFASIHFQQVITQGIIQFFMVLIIGLWLGYLHEITKSLWAPIIVHAVFNLLIAIF